MCITIAAAAAAVSCVFVRVVGTKRGLNYYIVIFKKEILRKNDIHTRV